MATGLCVRGIGGTGGEEFPGPPLLSHPTESEVAAVDGGGLGTSFAVLVLGPAPLSSAWVSEGIGAKYVLRRWSSPVGSHSIGLVLEFMGAGAVEGTVGAADTVG